MINKGPKTFTPVLVFFLIVVLAFFAVQIINIFIKGPLPEASQKQLEQLNPNLDQRIFEELEETK